LKEDPEVEHITKGQSDWLKASDMWVLGLAKDDTHGRDIEGRRLFQEVIGTTLAS
jgi:hypothetical protein